MFFVRADGLPATALATATGVGTTQGSGPTLALGGVTLNSTAANTSANLPSSSAVGSMVVVAVNGGTTATIFPATGGKINGQSANASYSVASGKGAVFMAINALDWVAAGG